MKKYACRMAAEESCDSSKALKDVLQRRTCVQPRKDKSPLALPGIDVFVNPARVEEKKQIIREKQDIAKKFFKKSDMQSCSAFCGSQHFHAFRRRTKTNT